MGPGGLPARLDFLTAGATKRWDSSDAAVFVAVILNWILGSRGKGVREKLDREADRAGVALG
jgi:hypothetical protein